jgi:hypothetical protein
MQNQVVDNYRVIIGTVVTFYNKHSFSTIFYFTNGFARQPFKSRLTNMASENKINLVAFPSHSTHLLQLHDVYV